MQGRYLGDEETESPPVMESESRPFSHRADHGSDQKTSTKKACAKSSLETSEVTGRTSLKELLVRAL